MSGIRITPPANKYAHLALFGTASFFALLGILLLGFPTGDRLVDAHMYWSAWTNPLYSSDYILWGPGYSYAPPFAQLLWVFTLLPWSWFAALWMIAAAVAYSWLLWPLRLSVRIPLVIAFALWTSDNIYWLLALVSVLGTSRPWMWSLPLLTKITPGVGVIWFAVRREWRSLLIALATAAVVVGLSYVVAPGLWLDWFRFLTRIDIARTGFTPLPIPMPTLLVRVPIAALIVAWGAVTGRPWTLPVSMLIAQPDINFTAFGLLAALPRTRQRIDERPIHLRALRRAPEQGPQPAEAG